MRTHRIYISYIGHNYCCVVKEFISVYGSYINDVTLLKAGVQAFCDGSNKVLVLKSVTMERGVVKYCEMPFMDEPFRKPV